MDPLTTLRCPLGQFPTPLHRHDGLGRLVGVDQLWIKRDDLTGFSWGGNKVRAVEYLLGDALAQQASKVVVAGGPSSNFAAIMAAAATAHGLGIEQVSYGDEPTRPVAALTAGRQSGAGVTFTHSADRAMMETVGRELAERCAAEGARPYLIGRGGASEVGALGFLRGARELIAQLDQLGADPKCIVIPLGSGGSTAGLLAGLAMAARPLTVIAVSVSRAPEDLEEQIVNTAARCAGLLGSRLSPQDIVSRLELRDARGGGFAKVDESAAALADSVSAATGLLIDQTYNAKTLRSMADEPVPSPAVYWHTGGLLGVIDQLHGYDTKFAEATCGEHPALAASRMGEAMR